MREGLFVEVPYSTANPILYSVPRMLYFDGGLLDVPSYESGSGTTRKWLGCLMNIWTPDWISKRGWLPSPVLFVIDQFSSGKGFCVFETFEPDACSSQQNLSLVLD